MKLKTILFPLLLSMGLMPVVCSCGDDEIEELTPGGGHANNTDDTAEDESQRKMLLGTWRLTEPDFYEEYTFNEDGTFVYIAKRYARRSVNGKQKKVLETLIPNLLFVYTTEDKAKEYVKDTPALSYLTFYYNHFELDNNQKNPPLTVSNKEMENFIIATCNKSEHLKFVDESQCHFKGGEIVKVIDGDFKGVVGRVARVAGQQRVIVELNCLCLIATAYIPTAFLLRL